ncbi:MAG: hypothetical protein EXQ85_07425 [Alphaproteobacteria bacterium]|nr:hypothetical protein [Alphaproteobacteria bacterium]
MPVHTSAIGMAQSSVTEVTLRWVLAYSASLGFVGPDYLHDDRGAALVVPPTFCVCLEWAAVGSASRFNQLGLTPEEVRRGVHVLQDSTFVAAIRPGMRVRTTSEIAYIRNTRAGALVVTRLESHEEETGDLLVRSWVGSMMRGVAADASMAGQAPADVIEPRGELPEGAASREVFLDRGLPHIYTECARIWNPIHTERAVALAAGLSDIIVHGTATWAIAAREVVAHHAAGDMSRLRRLVSRFRAPIIPGTAITIHHARRQSADGLAFSVLTERGDVALSDGFAELAAATGGGTKTATIAKQKVGLPS